MNADITIEVTPNAKIDAPEVTLPGKRLLKAREMLRLSQTDIARQLKLKLHFIEAIENDDYSKMPALTFVRGYLRIYARAVNIPGDEIIQAFNTLGLEEKQNHVSHQIFYKKQEAKQDLRLRWATFAVVAVLIVLFSTWWYSEHAAVPPTSSVSAVITHSLSAPTIAVDVVKPKTEAKVEASVENKPVTQIQAAPSQEVTQSDSGDEETSADSNTSEEN